MNEEEVKEGIDQIENALEFYSNEAFEPGESDWGDLDKAYILIKTIKDLYNIK